MKTLGDGMVCAFKDADDAFRAACEIQEAALAAETGEAPKLTIKVALNWGTVVTERGDVFGDTVNVCARLVSLAGPHHVLTTQETVDTLSQPLRSRCRHLYPLSVRGRVEKVEVSEVLWRFDDPDVTEELSRSALKAAVRVDWILKLTYSGDTTVVEPSGSIRLGRGQANDVVVPSSLASRVHARIYGRGGNFVIVDQSANGTYVAIDGHTRELQLRREEAVLGERGYIGLGGPASGTGDHVLRYRLERRKLA